MGFAVPEDHQVKLKEGKKKDKYLDLARELKNKWNMNVTVIPIVSNAFGTILKGLMIDKGSRRLRNERIS